MSPLPPRGGFVVVQTADLDRVMKLARLADPDLNPEANERGNAGRLLHKALQAIVAAPPRYGQAPYTSSSAPPPPPPRQPPPPPKPPPPPPPPPPRQPPPAYSNAAAPILRLWQGVLGRPATQNGIDLIEDWIEELGQKSVLGAACYAIEKGEDPDDAWRFFCNICRKRVREQAE